MGNGHFSEISQFSGVAKTDWSWGAVLFDMHNDGYKDIYVSNGIYQELTNQDFIDFFANDIIQRMTLTGKKEEKDSILNKMPSTTIPNYAYKNNQDLTFKDETENWGFNIRSFCNGAAYADLDGDGDMEIITNNINETAKIYNNNTNKKANYLAKFLLITYYYLIHIENITK